jgi:hypothetical protein
MHGIFEMEHFYEFEMTTDTMRERLDFFVEEKVLETAENDTVVVVANSAKAPTMLNYFV